VKYTEVYRRKAQHICIFGDPKSGKTELAASAAAIFRRVIWISMDNGHEVIFKLPPSLLEKFEFIILPDTKEFPVAVATCLELVKGTNTHICNNHGQVNCSHCRTTGKESATWTDIALNSLEADEVVVFDHGSQLSDSAMNFITKGKPLEYKPEWSDYSYQGAILNKILMNIQQAPYNTIFITHTCETEMEDGSKRLVPLSGTLNFSRNMGKFFDHIIYCRVANRKHSFGSATVYLASVLTGSRGDITLEEQNKDAPNVTTRPTLLPFFEGKMDREEEQEVKEQLEKVKEESKTIENFSEVKKVEVSMEVEIEKVEVSTEISTVNGHSKEAPVIEKSGAELAKERLAAMKARSTPSLSPSLSSTLSTPAASSLAAKLRGLSK
jgi:hypothetical protein